MSSDCKQEQTGNERKEDGILCLLYDPGKFDLRRNRASGFYLGRLSLLIWESILEVGVFPSMLNLKSRLPG